MSKRTELMEAMKANGVTHGRYQELASMTDAEYDAECEADWEFERHAKNTEGRTPRPFLHTYRPY